MGSAVSSQPVTMAPGVYNHPNVEFVNPKFRDEYLSRSDSGSSPNNQENPWVWLNAYSRIPVSQYLFAEYFSIDYKVLREKIFILHIIYFFNKTTENIFHAKNKSNKLIFTRNLAKKIC